MKPSNVLKLLSNPVAFYPGLVPITGSIKSTLLFCQLFYWRDATTNPLGVYKSVAEVEKETHLTYKEQIAARKALCDLGLITETYDRVNHRVFFLVNYDVLDELIEQEFLKRELDEVSKAHDNLSSTTYQKVKCQLPKSHFGNKQENTTKTKRVKKDYSAQFDTIWKAYPNKSNKSNSLKAFEKLNPDDELMEKMLKGIEASKQTPQWTDNNGRFIPNLQAWINGRRWEDEISSLTNNGQAGNIGGWI